MERVTIGAAFQEAVQRYQRLVALVIVQGQQRRELTYLELGREVESCALGLRLLGLKAGDAVFLMAENRLEWVVVDLALQSLGCLVVAQHPEDSPRSLGRILSDIQPALVVVSGEALLLKAQSLFRSLGMAARVLVMDAPSGQEAKGSLPLEEVMEAGRRAREAGERLEPLSGDPEGEASIIYSAGATHFPKGISLSHSNLLYYSRIFREVLPLDGTDLYLTLMALSATSGRQDLYACLMGGVPLGLVRADLMSSDLMEEICALDPTVVHQSFRLFERYRQLVVSDMERRHLYKKMSEWAMRVMRIQRAMRRQGEGSSPAFFLKRLGARAFLAVAKRGIRRLLGGRIRFFVSSGGQVADRTALLFTRMGLPILNTYSLTEAGGLVTMTPLGELLKLKTSGKPLTGVEVRVDPATGEILVKSPGGMRERPGKMQRAIRLEEGGWIRTGDRGQIDEDGFLTVKGRRNAFFYTSSGKKVFYETVEDALRQDHLIADAVVVGRGKPWISAVIVPEFLVLEEVLAYLEEEQGEVGLADVRALFESRISEALKGFPPQAHIKGFVVARRPLSLEKGELTHDLKVRRVIVARRYRSDLEALYLSRGGSRVGEALP